MDRDVLLWATLCAAAGRSGLVWAMLWAAMGHSAPSQSQVGTSQILVKINMFNDLSLVIRL